LEFQELLEAQAEVQVNGPVSVEPLSNGSPEEGEATAAEEVGVLEKKLEDLKSKNNVGFC